MCVDIEGNIYLRTDKEVVRYDTKTWREVPWDYGERRKARFNGPPADTISALPIPGDRPMWYHMGGMSVSPKGHLAVMCPNEKKKSNEPRGLLQKMTKDASANETRYEPAVYPGRHRFGEIHVWDRHGKIVYEDVIPGLPVLDGIAIDNADNIYVMAHSARRLDGKVFFDAQSGTLMRFSPRGARILNNEGGSMAEKTPIRLPKTEEPRRPKELNKFWVDGADWFFGGVGHCLRNSGGCNCWHSRFALDYFARSFAPESHRYSVAVVDSAGNLVTRLGSYGNPDDKGVHFVYPNFVATHTDRRLFVADPGNGRIASVKLGYHAEAKIALKDVKDEGK
jgi:hypothetical protein